MRSWSLRIAAALLAFLALAAGPSWSEATPGQPKAPKEGMHRTYLQVTYYYLPG